MQVEYLDREHNAVCVDLFEPITDQHEVKPGDKIICPTSEEYYGILDSKTMLPVLLTVKAYTKSFTFNYLDRLGNVIDSREYGHFKLVNHGAIRTDLCLKFKDCSVVQ